MPLLAIVAGCGLLKGEEPFTLGMVETDRVSIRVESPAGAPIARAIVMVRTVVPEQDYLVQASRELLFQGMTDENGVARGPLVRRSTDEKLDVVVLKPGFVGPYTDTSKLERFGEYAPASWQIVSAAAVTELHVPLRAVEVPR